MLTVVYLTRFSHKTKLIKHKHFLSLSLHQTTEQGTMVLTHVITKHTKQFICWRNTSTHTLTIISQHLQMFRFAFNTQVSWKWWMLVRSLWVECASGLALILSHSALCRNKGYMELFLDSSKSQRLRVRTTNFQLRRYMGFNSWCGLQMCVEESLCGFMWCEYVCVHTRGQGRYAAHVRILFQPSRLVIWSFEWVNELINYSVNERM